MGISFNLSEFDKTLDNFTEKVLPNPPDSILNDIEKIFYKFVWNGKKDKIKRSIIINEYEEGGLKMPNLKHA